jgi:DNA-directed RNA polymerase specialized sigma54-like protein
MTSLRLGLGHKIYLQLKIGLPFARANPLSGLSVLELEELLDQSVENVQDFYTQNPQWREQHPIEGRGNYFYGEDFSKRCKAVRGKIAREKYLEQPQVIVHEDYSTSHNPSLDQRIAEKLALFKREDTTERARVDQLFSKRFMKEWQWVKEQQVAIVDYLCAEQEAYIKSRNPFDMKPINLDDIAKTIEYSSSTVCRIVNNLTVQLPTGDVIFADELIPSGKLMSIQGRYALQQLKQDATVYENGKWILSDQDLVPLLHERFGIEVARRTVSKYRGMLDCKFNAIK